MSAATFNSLCSFQIYIELLRAHTVILIGETKIVSRNLLQNPHEGARGRGRVR
jgi:hypothetical protein